MVLLCNGTNIDSGMLAIRVHCQPVGSKRELCLEGGLKTRQRLDFTPGEFLHVVSSVGRPCGIVADTTGGTQDVQRGRRQSRSAWVLFHVSTMPRY